MALGIVFPSLRDISGHAFYKSRKFTFFLPAARAAQGEKVKSVILTFSEKFLLLQKVLNPKKQNFRKKPKNVSF